MKFIPKYLPANPIVAVSGGVDSIAAAHFLGVKLKKSIKVYHYNHNLRPQNDVMESRVRQFALDFNIPLIIKKNNNGALKTEDEFRRARWNALFDENYHLNVITSHHLDDCVESYLLNCFRGQEGFLPIPFFSIFQNGNGIWHPFLIEEKKKFREYVSKNNLNNYVVEDITNHITKGSRRNFIRNEIVPLLQREKMGLRKIVGKKILARM